MIPWWLRWRTTRRLLLELVTDSQVTGPERELGVARGKRPGLGTCQQPSRVKGPGLTAWQVKAGAMRGELEALPSSEELEELEELFNA